MSEQLVTTEEVLHLAQLILEKAKIRLAAQSSQNEPFVGVDPWIENLEYDVANVESILDYIREGKQTPEDNQDDLKGLQDTDAFDALVREGVNPLVAIHSIQSE